MRILVCGDRNWNNTKFMEDILLDIFQPNDTLIYGCARGADNMAYNILSKNFKDEYGDIDINICPFPADWGKYGKRAGPIRNRQMISEGKPELVLAFHNNISTSKGTLDMIKASNESGIEVRLYSGGD